MIQTQYLAQPPSSLSMKSPTYEPSALKVNHYLYSKSLATSMSKDRVQFHGDSKTKNVLNNGVPQIEQTQSKQTLGFRQNKVEIEDLEEAEIETGLHNQTENKTPCSSKESNKLTN